jgi:ADP-dependent NAD(P)H-hydrate dehydratase / NAD(P)H-hydrate epimerase
VIVDAIFGTGMTRDVEGIYREVIEQINKSGKEVMSVDIPSGINGDTGKVMGTAVEADCTVTFGLPKVGNLLLPGFTHCGRLYVSHISFPPGFYESPSLKVAVNLPPLTPPRNPQGHKGTFGDVLFVAGAASYLGAPYFSALSFLKGGGGYSRLATPRSLAPFIAGSGSEIVLIPQEETRSGSLAKVCKDDLLELAEKVDLVVLGPGLSLEEETQQLVRELAAEIRKPLLIDGDGLTALAKDLKILLRRKEETVLTPHPGEMSRLANLSVPEVLDDRVGVLQRTCRELNSHIVLKGAHSLIGAPDGNVFINMSGNSGMATAGSGDVLTGTIAAVYGLGLSIPDAVRKGVFIHGFAGDLAADVLGEDGLTAQSLMETLPLAMKLDREGLSLSYRDFYGGPRRIP